MKKEKIINEMLINNVHLGHRKNLLNKEMKKYILNINKKIHIINLEVTLKKLNNVIKIIKNIKIFKKKLLILCVEKNLKNFIKNSCEKVNMPYVNKRWLSGSLTNFITLKSSINNMNYIEIILKNEKFKIKKRKKILYEKKIKRLNSFLNGVRNLSNLPDYVFIINLKKHKKVVEEAKKAGVLTIGIVDTNNSIGNLDFFIPGNDDSYKSIIFYIKKIIKNLKNE